MLTEFDIHYETATAGSRSIRRFRERVSMEVVEAAPEDAPVAVRWEYGETRWYGGHHFFHAADLPPAPSGGVAAESRLSALLSREGQTTVTSVGSYVDTRPLSGDRKFTPARYPDLVDNGFRGLALRKLAALSRDFLLVGEEVWMRCGEPRLVLREGGRHFGPSVEVSTMDMTTESGRYGRHVSVPRLHDVALTWRLDNPRGLLAQAEAMGLTVAIPGVDILRPDSLQLDDVEAALVHGAAGFVADFRSGFLSGVAAGNARPLADRIAGLLSAPERDLEVLAELVAETAETISRSQYAPYLRIAVRRWEERPVLVALQHGPAPSAAP